MTAIAAVTGHAMATDWSPEEMLRAVERSPAAVAAHDKAAWLALFSAGGVVEDPVGTPPSRKGGHVTAAGDDDLSRFYDTFIAGNEIRFEVVRDLAGEREVVRDVVIHTRLATGLSIEVPAYLIYQLVDEGGLRLARLRACWDLRRRSLGALAMGLRGLYTLLVVTVHMFRVQGLRGVLGYSRALVSGIFEQGRRQVRAFADAVDKRDARALSALLGDGGAIEHPPGRVVGASELFAALGDGARFTVSEPTPAGWLTGFRFEVTRGTEVTRGVGFLEFDPRSRSVARVRLFDRAVAGSPERALPAHARRSTGGADGQGRGDSDGEQPAGALTEESMAEARDALRALVREGYQRPDELLERAEEELADEHGAAIIPQVPRLLDEARRELAEEMRSWPAVTDCDRLDAAFAELESLGIVARQNFTCCSNCGEGEIGAEMESAEARGVRVRGYTFFHIQDVWRAVGGEAIMLKYGPSPYDPAAVVPLGRELQAVMVRHQLRTEWDGTAEQCIAVYTDWKRRPPESAG